MLDINKRCQFFPRAGVDTIIFDYSLANRGKTPAFYTKSEFTIVRTEFFTDVDIGVAELLNDTMAKIERGQTGNGYHPAIFPAEQIPINDTHELVVMSGKGRSVFLIAVVCYPVMDSRLIGQDVRVFQIEADHTDRTQVGDGREHIPTEVIDYRDIR